MTSSFEASGGIMHVAPDDIRSLDHATRTNHRRNGLTIVTTRVSTGYPPSRSHGRGRGRPVERVPYLRRLAHDVYLNP